MQRLARAKCANGEHDRALDPLRPASLGVKEPRSEHDLDAAHHVDVALGSHRVGQGGDQLGFGFISVRDEDAIQPAGNMRGRRPLTAGDAHHIIPAPGPVWPRIVLESSS